MGGISRKRPRGAQRQRPKAAPRRRRRLTPPEAHAGGPSATSTRNSKCAPERAPWPERESLRTRIEGEYELQGQSAPSHLQREDAMPGRTNHPTMAQDHVQGWAVLV